MNKLQHTLFKVLKCTNIQVHPGILNVDVLILELKDRMMLSEDVVEKIREEVSELE